MNPVRYVLLLLLAVLAAPARALEPAPTFESDVKPILRKHCLTCHNGERPRGELDLTNFGGVMAGGISGKAVVAKKPDESPLYTMAAHLEDPKMPPNKPKIPQRELDSIRKWIEGGLVEKGGGSAVATPTAAAPAGLTAPAVLARTSPVTALAVSPLGALAAVPGRRQVLVFELPGGKLLGAPPFPEGEVQTLKFSRDGKILIAGGGLGGQSGVVIGFEVGAWKRLFSIGDELDAVLAADISPDKSLVALGGPGRVVKVYSVADGKLLHTLRKATDWVLSIEFSPEGLLLAAGDRFGGLYVWEAKSGKEFLTLRGHTKGVSGLAWRADSDVLASSSEDRTLRLWDMHSGAETAKWEADPEGVLDVAFHAGGRLATAGRDGRAKVWDAKGKSLAELGPAADAVLKVAFAADAASIVTADWSGEVRIRPVAGGEGARLSLPVSAPPVVGAAVPVPAPQAILATVPAAARRSASEPTATSADLARKRAALKAVEDAVEKMKEEAARNPKNPALAKAYIQMCEVALVLKTEVLEAEAMAAANPEGNK